MTPLCFAYYCSGHGYGHATRVSALACHLLNLPEKEKPIIHIVSSAPKHVFAGSIAQGALYRYSEIDPVIVQPLAYRVDRQQSVEVLKNFVSKKSELLEIEQQWLVNIKAHAVLSDAAFLGCLAAKSVGIPSILITNFTFDSVYSYLSTPILDVVSPQQNNHLATESHPSHNFEGVVPDIPVPLSELESLVAEIYAGYRCADVLFLLPGCIPIPSFSVFPSLPSVEWVDISSNRFYPKIIDFLTQPTSSYNLHHGIPFSSSRVPTMQYKARLVITAPLLVRPPTSSPSVYTPEGRSRLLASIGIPEHLHDPVQTKILIVSFGGQVFHRPSRRSSRDHSRSNSPSQEPSFIMHGLGISNPTAKHQTLSLNFHPIHQNGDPPSLLSGSCDTVRQKQLIASPPLATPSHIWIPGAPPVFKPPSTPSLQTGFSVPTLTTVPPTPNPYNEAICSDLTPDGSLVEGPCLLPDATWIAIVCGVSKEQWNIQCEDQDSGLPDQFFVAPMDVYMPDLTAVGDVLLGKLGYGTVSECVDSSTPFVYISRPLFIEEHGLRLLLDREGVGVELSRQSYEAGEWATAVEEAWRGGETAKARKRAEMVTGIDAARREIEGREMARTILQWTLDWWGDLDIIETT